MTEHTQPLNLPVDLFKANAAFQQRLLELLRESSQRQWNAMQQASQHTLEEARAAASQKPADGTLPLEWPLQSAAQHLHQQWAQLQAAAQTSSQSQQELLSGIQQAAQQWQQDTSEAFKTHNPAACLGAFAGGAPTVEWLKQWSSLVMQPVQAVQPGAASAAAKSKT